MKVVIIGAGNLSTHLSIALQKAGFEILQIYSRTVASAKELALQLKVPYTTDILSISYDASLYIFSVSDDAVSSVSENFISTDALVVHTAGSLPLDIFSKKFKNYGVFYPLQTFTKGRTVDFSNIPVFLEANTQENLNILQNVANSISQNVYFATSKERELLHLAAIFCCNFVNHLYDLSAQIAQQAGFEFSILSQLILETARKAITVDDPKKVQTGPAIRNDRKILQKHLDLLNSQPEYREIYFQLSKNIAFLSQQNKQMNIK